MHLRIPEQVFVSPQKYDILSFLTDNLDPEGEKSGAIAVPV